MFDRVKLRDEPHPIEEILYGGAQSGGASNTHSEGITHSEGKTYKTGQTLSAGTISSTGKTLPAGTTHPAGQTLETGITHSKGLTRQRGSTGHVVASSRQAPATPVSPERDFQKVPNSITREMAARLFRGKSKQLYDYLWSQSRGAIAPSRTVRRSRPQLLKGAGYGSMGTVERCVDFLVEVGLIKVRSIVGESEGNEYEIFTPEEVAPALFGLSSSTGSTYQTGSTGSTLKQVIPVLPETGSTGSTSNLIGSDTSSESKTSFKTKDEKFDDEALALFAAAMSKATLDLTGKSLSPSEAQRWAELADVLVTELKIAAGRTSVSSVPAFLAEHLRRRLFKKDQKQLASEAVTEVQAVPAAQRVDSSQCPDCFGTGMHYPEGYDKGVARCRHEKLTAPAASSALTPAAAAQPQTDGDLIEMAIGFLHQGLEIEAIGQLLSASIDAEHWPRIRQAALERYEREREQARPPTTA